MRPELPTGTVTFLFTDIEGSTRLLHALGPDAYADALAEHRRLLRDAFAAHGGVEVDTQGDAFFVAFPTAPGAAAAAREAQAALADGPITVRMGLHTGSPTRTTEGYVGVDVHRGARIAALAHGGQVLVSEATAALLAHGEPLTDLGRHRLKDFDGPARLHQLGVTSFPPLRSPGTIDLPTPATPFLGRDEELHDALSVVLGPDPAILTIIGPGGIGKTRFALELTRLLAEDADGGSMFVPLAPLRDPLLVLPAIAEAIGAEQPEPASIAARTGEKRTHVLLDNIEQLLPEAAPVLSSLVAAVPTLRLLVTSREALQVAAEHRFDLPPLGRGEAVELFLSRARAVRPQIGESSAIPELCDRLDRLPLALELAAARTRLLLPEALLERLSTRLDLPAPRDADRRHATLRATIEWSFDLLDETERQLFTRLAVFPAGCTLEAAEDVSGADLDTLASLIDKSLLRRRSDPTGERYWMLETIHEFARARLADDAGREELSRRHATWILELARSSHLSLESLGLEQDFAAVHRERDGIRAAIDWAIEHDPPLAADIVLSLEQYWTTAAPSEGRPAVEALLARPEALSDPALARLHRAHGGLVILRGDVERGEESYTRALSIFRTLGDEMNAVGLLSRFAVHHGHDGDTDEARRLVADVRAANDAVGNPLVEPQMLSTLARVAAREGDLETARELSRRSTELSAEVDFSLWRLWELDELLDIELGLGLLDDAERTGREALELARQLDDHRVAMSLLTGLALVALRRGDERRAGIVWGAVAAARQDAGASPPVDDLARTSPLRECETEAFRSAAAEGGLLTLEHALSFALGETPAEP